jgi:hypothetical protein
MRGAAFTAAAVVGIGATVAIAAMLDAGAGAAGLGALAITVFAAIAYVVTDSGERGREVGLPSWES